MEHFIGGWLPDLPDHRDYEFEGTYSLSALPPAVDLRASDSEIYNQGSLGSCTGNAIAALFQFVNRKMGHKDFIPSRLFIYYEERRLLGTIKKDSGAYLRDGMKTIAKKGVCPEPTWPYIIEQFKTKPSAAAYAEAKSHQAIEYMRIMESVDRLKQCLADGYPFVFGFSVYESFRTHTVNSTGVMTVPAKTEKLLSGHAIMAVGYDDEKRHFILRNSWGTGWGDKGYFYMPYEYIESRKLTDDFWTLRTVELAK